MKPKKKAAHPRVHKDEITAVYADRHGNICEADGIRGLGRIGASKVSLRPADLIPLPESADLMFMPEHSAVGRRNPAAGLYAHASARLSSCRYGCAAAALWVYGGCRPSWAAVCRCCLHGRE